MGLAGLPVPGTLAALAVALSSGCGTAPYGKEADREASVLLRQARAITHQSGLAEARDWVTENLQREDQSAGNLERRVLRTTREPGWFYPDSWAALPRERRGEIALVIVPGTRSGFGAKSHLTRDCLFAAAAKSREMGFATHFIQTLPRGAVEENADLLAERIAPVFETADRVALVMLSKGAHDVIHYLQHDATRLPAAHRQKLVVVLSLAGTVQGSVVADWFAHSDDPVAGTTRAWLALSGQADGLTMLRTVARSPWNETLAGDLHRSFPRLTWVSLAMVPDGPDGTIRERLWAPGIRRKIRQTSPYFSPNDGLVETAASVLPDFIRVPEWIVLAEGSHAMPNGHYRDGSRIAPRTSIPGEEDLRPESGGEVMSAYLRALPQSLLR